MQKINSIPKRNTKNSLRQIKKDKDGNLIYLYSTNKEEQHAGIAAAKEKGYDVLLMDGPLDIHFINYLEQKGDGKNRYERVDSDTIDRLIKR